jgi:hypothetical protein
MLNHFIAVLMRHLRLLSFLFLLVAAALALPACAAKSGCEATESLKPSKDRKGEYKPSKAKSGLFPKKIAKKMR